MPRPASEAPSGSISATAIATATGTPGPEPSSYSKSQVSRLCEQIDERVQTFLDRPIEGNWPYVWLDATYVKARRYHHIVSVAIIVVVGANTEGRREVLGMIVGHSEAEPFWVEFLRGLIRRGVKLVASDAHEGLKAAITKVLSGTWQRCLVGLLKKPSLSDSLMPATIRRGVRCWEANLGVSRSC